MANSQSGESMLERIVRVLETFSSDRTVQTPSEIGRRAGLPSATAHRIVDSIAAVGFLEKDAEGRVQLGMRLWELALRGSFALRLRQAALPHMNFIQEEIKQHTQLAVLENQEALFIERLSHPEAGSNITKIAGRLPLHASSSGLVLLANSSPEFRENFLKHPLQRVGPATVTDPDALERLLARVRKQGYVVAPASVEQVSTGVAVPLRDAGVVRAALSVILPIDWDTDEALELLLAQAREIDSSLTKLRRHEN